MKVIVDCLGGILDGEHSSLIEDRESLAAAVYASTKELAIGEQFCYSPMTFDCKYPYRRIMNSSGHSIDVTITSTRLTPHVYRIVDRIQDEEMALAQAQFCGFDLSTTAYFVTYRVLD